MFSDLLFLIFELALLNVMLQHPNSAQTLRFPMVALKEGEHSIKVIAFVDEAGSFGRDAVEKTLYVVVCGYCVVLLQKISQS